jgi:SAM-dependent methyltransferase
MLPSTTYSDDDAAALYDVLNPWGPSDAFYLELVLEARSVLDVGCGTGTLLHRAREAGHEGRLCGIDPDASRLRVARRRTDVEWISCTAAAMEFDREFELAVMTGHAFQELVGDADIDRSLAAVRRALPDGGRFAFETRNPLARAWEQWAPENATDVVDGSGRGLRIWHEVEVVVDGVVTFTETTGHRDGAPLRVDRASLRFLDVDALDGALARAGLTVEARYGDWRREPFEAGSPEIITIARTAAL